MSIVVSPKFLEDRQLSDIEFFALSNRLVQVLKFPELTLTIEGTQTVEEDAELVC